MRLILIDNFYIRNIVKGMIIDQRVVSMVDKILKKLNYTYTELLFGLFTVYSSRYTGAEDSDTARLFPHIKILGIDTVKPHLQKVVFGDVYDLIYSYSMGYIEESSFNSLLYDDVYTWLSDTYTNEIVDTYFDEVIMLLSNLFINIEFELLRQHFMSDNYVGNTYLYLGLDVDKLVVQIA